MSADATHDDATAARIREIVDQAPPLTEDQLLQLRDAGVPIIAEVASR